MVSISIYISSIIIWIQIFSVGVVACSSLLLLLVSSTSTSTSTSNLVRRVGVQINGMTQITVDVSTKGHIQARSLLE